MRRPAFHHGCTALALAAAGLAVPAMGQDQPLPDAQGQPAPAGEVAEPSDDDEQLPAQDTGVALAPGPLIYTPADFVQYAPRSALDMLQQVPGFNIQESGGQGAGSARPPAMSC